MDFSIGILSLSKNSYFWTLICFVEVFLFHLYAWKFESLDNKSCFVFGRQGAIFNSLFEPFCPSHVAEATWLYSLVVGALWYVFVWKNNVK